MLQINHGLRVPAMSNEAYVYATTLSQCENQACLKALYDWKEVGGHKGASITPSK